MKKGRKKNARGLKIRSAKQTEMPAHDRPYLPVKGLITIVKPVRRSARVGEADASFKSKISRDYVPRTVLLSLTHARSPTTGYHRLSSPPSSSSSPLSAPAHDRSIDRSIGNITIPKARTDIASRQRRKIVMRL